jgi:hypothetical protein
MNYTTTDPPDPRIAAAAKVICAMDPDEPWPTDQHPAFGWSTGDTMRLAAGDTEWLEHIIEAMDDVDPMRGTRVIVVVDGQEEQP